MTLQFIDIVKSILCIVLVASATSCYRMPNENDYSLIPATNNRDFTREGGSDLKKLPGIGY